ncbi:hypothetical protein niasHS_007422 [Heterodera schachtii]|uniref:Uncharacterized protein n=1 Tax=Heterodera schachtii TaxID=97005 RepID=A0ABD2JXL7_HETSC
MQMMGSGEERKALGREGTYRMVAHIGSDIRRRWTVKGGEARDRTKEEGSESAKECCHCHLLILIPSYESNSERTDEEPINYFQKICWEEFFEDAKFKVS